MKRILMLPNPYKDVGLSVSGRIADILSAHGTRVYASEPAASHLVGHGVRPMTELDGEPELLIAVGGDGTVLSAAQDAARGSFPLLGINMGRLGFLAELESGALASLERLYTKDYTLVSRMMLEVTVELDGKCEKMGCTPLNDVVFSHERGDGLCELALLDGDGNRIDYHADGLILATPSGSTAYSLSAGGPIVDDTVEAICVTPVCPHSFFSRSVVFGRDTHLTVENCSLHGKSAVVSLDGRDELCLPVGGRVHVSRSPRPLWMLTFDGHATIATLNRKMQMADMKYR